MFRKISFALIAALAVGTAALSPTAASAKPWGKGWHPHYGIGFGAGLIGTAIVADSMSSCYVQRWVETPKGPRLRTFYVCY
jgi:hypothetical protein